eukprot:CAMPEP_0113545908 /NCGR_PEP_ID=MMETSP0015_2-20120614/11520_1 /TAXON_ID=2838 /ORGANISM="Odontella" /LENGTH=254 /DNA_ID=CAMNT_0000446321 /DNA_START=23 /DNA_END=786 /DNA_ORIENTATION=- /assembly_acc=CAM_ASM_000160
MSMPKKSSLPSGSGTFQPLRHRSGTMRDRLHGYTKRTLGAGGSMNEAVALPPGESCAGWVAVHAIDFYNDISTIWAVMSEDPYLNSFQPGEGFPSGVEYRWSEGTGRDATTVKVSAPVYIEKVLHWIADQMNDESKFPDDDDEEEALRVFQTPQFAAAVRADIPEALSGVRHHLLQLLRDAGGAGDGAPPEHVLQALHVLLHGVRPLAGEGDRAAGGFGQADSEAILRGEAGAAERVAGRRFHRRLFDRGPCLY